MRGRTKDFTLVRSTTVEPGTLLTLTFGRYGILVVSSPLHAETDRGVLKKVHYLFMRGSNKFSNN